MSFPWAALMYTALDMGISMADFWEMSPRAVLMINREMGRRFERQREVQPAAAPHQNPVKLKRLPRP